jgi:3-dehydroquinate synthase
MVIAAKASHALGWSDEDCTQAIIDANKNNNLPVECNFASADLADIALSDKKRTGGTINFVVPKVLGECELKKIPVEVLYKIAEWK